MKKKLAIISASKDQLPLVEKANEMGIETHCFSWDKKAEHTVCRGIADYFHPISILEKEQILEKCRELKIDGVLSMVSDISMPTVAYIAENMGLIGNRYADTFITGNKYKARQAMLEKGVNSPRFVLVQDGQIPDLTGFIYPLIVKPIDRCGSIGVTKVNTEAELKEALQRAEQLSFSGQTIVEEFIAGTELSAETISWNGKHYLLAVTDKVTSEAPYFVEMAHHQPTQFSPDIVARIENEARQALIALNIRYGACDVELKVTADGNVYPIEVNARLGGDETYAMVENSTGIDHLKMIINIALGYWEEPEIIYRSHTGIHFWCEGQEWVKQVIDHKDKYPEIVKAVILRNEDLKPLQSSSDRNGYFIYKSDMRKTRKDFLL